MLARDQQRWVGGWELEGEVVVVVVKGWGCSMAASLFLVDPQETICAGGID